jgi:hypothetical protein
MDNKKVNVIRSVRGRMTNEKIYNIAALLIEAGYTVRVCTVNVPGKQTKETIIEYWE